MTDVKPFGHSHGNVTDMAATPLGRAITHRGYSVHEVSRGTKIDRWTLMDYLNARPPRSDSADHHRVGHGFHANRNARITPRHLARLSTFLKIPAAKLQHRGG